MVEEGETFEGQVYGSSSPIGVVTDGGSDSIKADNWSRKVRVERYIRSGESISIAGGVAVGDISEVRLCA